MYQMPAVLERMPNETIKNTEWIKGLGTEAEDQCCFALLSVGYPRWRDDYASDE